MSAESGSFRQLPSINTGQLDIDRFPAGAYRANLYVYDAFGRIEWFALLPQSFTEGRYFTIGRGSDCDITLNDGAVSARHAFISAEDGDLIIRDLRSTNGTTVNKIPLTEHILAHGDVIRMGATDVRFLFSYRESPVHLVLEFQEGANAGKTVATYGASTNIGRLNCAINLQGRGVAAQHVRVDAFGAQLLYVVNLHPENEVLLNGERVERIAPARQGDRLTVGEHVIVLRVADAAELIDAVPMGDGTLRVAEQTPGHGAEPIARMSATDMRLLSAHIDAIDTHSKPPAAAPVSSAPPMPELPKTAPPPAMMPPTLSPSPALAPPRAASLSEPSVVVGPPPRVSKPIELREPPPQPKGGRRALWTIILLPALIAGLIVGAFVVQLPQSTRLEATLLTADAPRTTVQSPAVGRIDRMLVQPGQRVVIDDPIAELTDVDAERRLAQVKARIAELRAKTPTQRTIKRPVPPAVRRRMQVARNERESASIAAEAARGAFERRELSLEQFKLAQARAERTRREFFAAQAAYDEASRRKITKTEGGVTPADEAEIRRLENEQITLGTQLKMTVKSTVSGTVLSLGEGVAPQRMLTRDATLMVVQSGAAERSLRIKVPEALLQTVESMGQGVLKADGVRPITLPLGRADAKALPDGTYAMRTGVPPLVSDVLKPDQPLTVEVQLPSRSALFVLWDRITGE